MTRMTSPAPEAEAKHWHYAVTLSRPENPGRIETMTGPETNLGKKAAKLQLQQTIRTAQANVRFTDPAGPDREPADVWMESDELLWLNIPVGPNPLFCVYPCDGDCTASALAHRDEVAGHLKAAGMDVDLEQPARLN
jgi:hypothetical protein